MAKGVFVENTLLDKEEEKQGNQRNSEFCSPRLQLAAETGEAPLYRGCVDSACVPVLCDLVLALIATAMW